MVLGWYWSPGGGGGGTAGVRSRDGVPRVYGHGGVGVGGYAGV